MTIRIMRPEPRNLWPVKFCEARGEEDMKYFWFLSILLSTGVCGMIFINLHLNVHYSHPSVRLPKWLSNRPRLTNIPFMPASDLGDLCSSSSGQSGVCTAEQECRGPGREKLGVCTLFKSVCCKGEILHSYFDKRNSEVACRKGFVSFRKHLEVLGIQESFISGA